MEALMIIGLLVVLAGLYFAIRKFNIYSIEKFEYDFLNIWKLVLIILAIISAFIALNLMDDETQSLNVLVLMSVSFIMIVSMIVINIRATNILIGLTGSFLQVFIGIVVAIIIIATIIASFKEKKYYK